MYTHINVYICNAINHTTMNDNTNHNHNHDNHHNTNNTQHLSASGVQDLGDPASHARGVSEPSGARALAARSREP